MATVEALTIIEVPYAGPRTNAPGDWAFSDYISSGAYAAAGVPYEVQRAPMPLAAASSQEETLGAMGGAIAALVAAARREGRGVVLVGGNCQHATGVIGGLQDADGAGARIGLVWFDAHGDVNTPQTTLSGSLGGMPLAVIAGLAHPLWRTGSHMRAPLPIDRLILVDGRNLDDPEARLVDAVGLRVAAPAPGFPGVSLVDAVQRLAAEADLIALHIDADVLDVSLMPNHVTGEPDGPDLEQIRRAIDVVMATGKVASHAVVSVFTGEPGRATSVQAGCELIRAGIAGWARYGLPAPP